MKMLGRAAALPGPKGAPPLVVPHAFYYASLIASETRKVTYVMVLPHLKAYGSLMDQQNFHMNLMQNIN
jgi:hypothetical protein